MKITIIEDEDIVAEDLELNIKNIIGEAQIVRISSVKEGLAYFRELKDLPDLIFSDLQLGDGMSFEILFSVRLPVPVIFCTAYGDHFIEAFKKSGVDYIVRPFTSPMLEKVLRKCLVKSGSCADAQAARYAILKEVLKSDIRQHAASLLVTHQDRIIPVRMEDIAIFYMERNVTHLKTFSGKCYLHGQSLEELEILSGNCFFRVNLHLLICKRAVTDVSGLFTLGLSVRLGEFHHTKLKVGREKASRFLAWLADK